MRQKKIILIAVFITLVSACSLKTLYNRLDYLIPAYVEGMVSLDDVLELKVEQRAEVLINWHRNTQLVQYADWLRNVQQDAGPQLTGERLLQHIETLESFWKILSLKINQEMVMLLPLLDAEKRTELYASIADKNEDFRDEYIDIDEDERIESYSERVLENYENWLGELSDEQESSIALAAQKLQSSASLRLEQRLIWQKAIQQILDNNESAELKAEHLRTFFADFDISDHAEMNRISEANLQIIVQLTVAIVHSLTPQQKAYFIDKTNDYIRIFTELAENR